MPAVMVPLSPAGEAGADDAPPVLGAADGVVDGSLGAPHAARPAVIAAAALKLPASLRRFRREVTGI